jgi:hypothetical protein
MFDPFERMLEAQRIIRDRQAAIVSVLNEARFPFALFASNATVVWIESVDPSAVRQYRNIEFLVNREDLRRINNALTPLGLIPEMKADHIQFRSEYNSRDRRNDRAYFASEQLNGIDVNGIAVTLPTLDAVETVQGIPIVPLDKLVEFQLRRFKLDDKVDIRDMIDAGLVDESWPAKFPPELAARLQHILDTPDG